MPLCDHCRPPLDNLASWEGPHGGRPMVIVQSLTRKFPQRYVAALRVQFGFFAEIDLPALLEAIGAEFRHPPTSDRDQHT